MSDGTFELSRRRTLAALGTIGIASVGAGLGTGAYFSDQETFENNRLVAGTLDLTVTASQHYVDWLPDTDTPTGNVSPPAPQETDDAEMADGTPDIVLDDGGIESAEPIELSLADDTEDDGDAEDVPNDENALEFAIGSKVNDINGGVPPGDRGESLCTVAPTADGGVGRPVIDLRDVKPGDFGFVRFEFASCDNPAFLRYTGDVTSTSENGTTEPEADDPDEIDGTVELLDTVVIGVVDGDVYQELAAGNQVSVSRQGTLRDLMDLNEPAAGNVPAPDGGGAEGARNCFAGGSNYRRTLVWWVPLDHGNEIQSDSATFELGLYAEQCRHNDGTGMPPETAQVRLNDQPITGTTVTVDSVGLPEAGYVVIHDARLQSGQPLASVVGVSDYLPAGFHDDVPVTLFTGVPGQPQRNFDDSPFPDPGAGETGSGTLIAMPHDETNDNQTYNFVETGAGRDIPFFEADGSGPVIDPATVKVEQP